MLSISWCLLKSLFLLGSQKNGFILFFRTHFYVGSANFDWRSLTQVKEMGILVKDCPRLAQDMAKIFDVYWALGGDGVSIPDKSEYCHIAVVVFLNAPHNFTL
jgi:hypothetical protein